MTHWAIASTLSRDNVLDSFRHRSLVQRMACKHIWEVLDTQKTGSYEDLLTLHTKFYELGTGIGHNTNLILRYSKRNKLRDTFTFIR